MQVKMQAFKMGISLKNNIYQKTNLQPNKKKQVKSMVLEHFLRRKGYAENEGDLGRGISVQGVRNKYIVEKCRII